MVTVTCFVEETVKAYTHIIQIYICKICEYYIKYMQWLCNGKADFYYFILFTFIFSVMVQKG